ASAAREAARRPLTGRSLRTATERPELVPDEVERGHEDDRDGLRREFVEPAVDDQQVQHDEVRPECRDRDEEEAHPLDADVAAVLAKGPDPVPDVVAGDGDEERARRGHEIVEPPVQQHVVDPEVDEIADRTDHAELAELLPVSDREERCDEPRPRRLESGGRAAPGRPRAERVFLLRPWEPARAPPTRPPPRPPAAPCP